MPNHIIDTGNQTLSGNFTTIGYLSATGILYGDGSGLTNLPSSGSGGAYLPLSGGTLTGSLTANNNVLILGTLSASQYLGLSIPSGNYLPLSGGTLTGGLDVTGNISVTGNATVTGSLTSGAHTFITGLGAVTQLKGPTDQALQIAAATPIAAASAQAGNALTLLAGNAIGGLTNNGPAAGGNVTITGGAAHQGLAANSANGGTVTITGGAPSQNGDPGNVAIVGGVGTFKTSGAEGAITLTTPAAENRVTGGAIIVTTGVGGLFASGVSNGTGAGGGPITFTSGAGGTSAADVNSAGGAGGTLSMTLGAGGAAIRTGAITTAVGGIGGSFSVTAGSGGASITASSGTRVGGNGGNITQTTGTGGAGSTTNGNGGNYNIVTGSGGSGIGTAGTIGSINLNPGTTNVLTISSTAIRATQPLNLENGTTANSMFVYNTYTDATTYERGFLKWTTNVFQIGADKGSVGGIARSIDIQTDGTTRMSIAAAGTVNVVGHFSAATKAFLIPHPTKSDKKLQYACLEGPENGVYIRGKTDESIITLPEYWKELVDEDSVTVTVTAINEFQPLFVKSQNSSIVEIGGATGFYNYVIYGERKDVAKLQTEI